MFKPKKKQRIKKTIQFLLMMMVSLLLSACNNEQTYILDTYDNETMVMADMSNGIIVNGVRLDGVQFQTAGEGNTPTHVPLLAVSQALGVTVMWNYATREISLYGLKGSIIFEIGSVSYSVDGEIVTIHNSPSFVLDNQTYVPLQFFGDVFGINNVYYEDGQIFIYE